MNLKHEMYLPLCCFIIVSCLHQAHAETPEHPLAHRFVKGYAQNERRLAAIDRELESLPQPYMREPTGTGGFLTHGKRRAKAEVALTFTWEHPVELDAVALFPLRLFIDEIYDNNLYWPSSITIDTQIGGERVVLAECINSQPLIRQSLPELIRFPPVSTVNVTIRCTGLQQHPREKWYAAGFAEICIFSGAANLAPRATIGHKGSRQGYHVLAGAFLTDAQTPLGLPELVHGVDGQSFVKVLLRTEKVLPEPYVLTFDFPQAVPVDAVRLDPAIEHAYGQSFPERFTIELLDDKGNTLQKHRKHEAFALRNPGLNPYMAYFPETSATAIRWTILEAAQPTREASLAVTFSEITALHNGVIQPDLSAVERPEGQRKDRNKGRAGSDTVLRGSLAASCDGLTHLGRLLPLREWIEGLVRRQQLLEEQLALSSAQQHALTMVHNSLVWGALTLLVLVIGISLFLVTRARFRSRKTIRMARARIASDLHDDVGSNLGTIILHTEKLLDSASDPQKRERLRSIFRLTRESVFGLREVLHSTAPEVGRAQDVVSYMRELAGLILGKTSFSFEADPATGETMPSGTPLRKGILLFYKEALYNAKTHSNCSQVEIAVRCANHALVLSIKDNGIGIEEQLLKKPRTLRTLRQRAEWLNAELQIESAAGKGTQLALSVPLD